MKVSNSQERIRALMDDLGINQAEVCRRTGIKKASLSNYLSGKREPRQDAISKIAEAFHVSPAWLMGYDGKSPFDDFGNGFPWLWDAEEETVKGEIKKARSLKSVYDTYGFEAYKAIETFCALPADGKKEVLSYLDYLCSKHGILNKLSTEEDLLNEYKPEND